jgi:nucleoside-diphosphate-sugar epimerase
VDVNGINKLAAEMYYSLYHDVYGMRTVNLRLTNTYGPRMDLLSTSKGFLGQFIRQAILNQTVRLFGDGQQRRDFNYVDDAVQALLLAGVVQGIEGRSFNLGHSRAYSLREVIELLHELTDFECECVPFPADHKAIDIGDYFADFSAWRAATGWEPTIDLREGLAETVAFFREHREQYLRSNHDQGVRLPA